MAYIHAKGEWRKFDLKNHNTGENLVCIASLDEAETLYKNDFIDKTSIRQCLRRKAFTFEHLNIIDYIGVLFLDRESLNTVGEKFCICSGSKSLIIIHENTDLANMIINELIAEQADVQTGISKLFISLMEKTIIGHIEQHEQIEDEIALLENAFLTDRSNVGPDRILVLQKKLLVFKRFYEQLQYVLDDIQEAKYNLIEEDNMRLYTLFTRRIERLLRNVLVLREYVTQVRESYEAETDISLNRIMRLFTVVTVIFMPLTLIVGWYGMNLKMPEYKWIWSYPLVISISLIVVVLTIVFFKKNKWF